MIKKLIRNVLDILGIPYEIARVEFENETAILKSNGWVTVTDGKTKDMLPITLCSEELIEKFGRIVNPEYYEEKDKQDKEQ